MGKGTEFERETIKNLKTLFTNPSSLASKAKLAAKFKAKPIVSNMPDLPDSSLEIFFSIETDPMRDVCYFHGFLERKSKDLNSVKYWAFFADHSIPQEEKCAFEAAYNYLQKSKPFVMYYYTKYERTIWRKL